MESTARLQYGGRFERNCAAGKIKALVDESLAVYEKSLDEAAAKVMARLNAGDKLRMMWVSGPSSSGKTTTTVKLTERLQKRGLRFLMLNLTIISGLC